MVFPSFFSSFLAIVKTLSPDVELKRENMADWHMILNRGRTSWLMNNQQETMKSGRYIGVMSGTSLDGVDVVLAAIDETMVVQQACINWPIAQPLRQDILEICQGQKLTLSQLGRLDKRLGQLFAEAVQALLCQQRLQAHHIMAIGCHGQTVWHEPASEGGNTLQIGDNNLIAALTGISVVGDFRRRDMALGGQGAPLVPAFHQALLSDATQRRMVLNIGGIANLTLLFPRHPVKGYDTGPGNMLLDSWIWHQSRKPFDQNGAWAQSGNVIIPLLQQMLNDAYFRAPAPKSTGREYFNYDWLTRQLALFPALAPQDVQATLLELSAKSIADQVLLHGGCEKLLVCGGGRRNLLLMRRLATLLGQTDVTTTDEAGINGDYLEALAFAWLACRTLSGLPGNLPSVTGASQASILGAIFPANPARFHQQ